MAASSSLSGRVAAVTGGARGIGLAIAQSLARRGACLAIGDLDGGAAEYAAAGLDGEAIGVALDVTNVESFEGFLDMAADRLGGLDVLVNNAGVMVVGPFADANVAATTRVMDVNLGGVVTGMRLAIPRLRQSGGGQIVNVVSGAGWVPPPALAAYSASKHAVKGLSDAVRDELRDDRIHVTAVYPMLVRTELAVGTGPARGGRWISPDEVGEAVAAAVERPRDEVFVPRWVSGLLRLQAALPPRGRALLARAFGVDKLYTSVDPKSRADYERGIAGG